jgi:hypothetical protein
MELHRYRFAAAYAACDRKGPHILRSRPGIRFNEHIEGDGPSVFAHQAPAMLIT